MPSCSPEVGLEELEFGLELAVKVGAVEEVDPVE